MEHNGQPLHRLWTYHSRGCSDRTAIRISNGRARCRIRHNPVKRDATSKRSLQVARSSPSADPSQTKGIPHARTYSPSGPQLPISQICISSTSHVPSRTSTAPGSLLARPPAVGAPMPLPASTNSSARRSPDLRRDGEDGHLGSPRCRVKPWTAGCRCTRTAVARRVVEACGTSC